MSRAAGTIANWLPIAALVRAALAAAVLALSPAGAPAQQGDALPQYTEAELGRWVLGDGGEHTLAAASLVRLEALHRAVGLSFVQRSKLALAAHGDVRRFCEAVNQIKLQFHGRPLTEPEQQDCSSQCSTLARRREAGLHGPGSLFAKTLTTTLDSAQLAAIHDADRLLAETRRTERIQLVLTTLDTCVSMNEAQRAQAESLLDRKIPAPEPGSSAAGWKLRFLKALLEIPDSDWKAVFREEQWESVRDLLDSYRQSLQFAEQVEKRKSS